MMLAKVDSIIIMSELLKIEEKLCGQSDEVMERRVALAPCPLNENLMKEQEKLDELEDIIVETIDRLEEFIKTME